MVRFETSNGTTANPRLKVFSVSFHRIKFNKEILTKLLERMHQVSISLLCSSAYQTTEGFYEIKHFVTQAKSL